jgi:hypothetical protein
VLVLLLMSLVPLLLLLLVMRGTPWLPLVGTCPITGTTTILISSSSIKV